MNGIYIYMYNIHYTYTYTIYVLYDANDDRLADIE